MRPGRDRGEGTPPWDKGINCTAFTVLSDTKNSGTLLFLPIFGQVDLDLLKNRWAPEPRSLNFKNIPGLEARIWSMFWGRQFEGARKLQPFMHSLANSLIYLFKHQLLSTIYSVPSMTK